MVWIMAECDDRKMLNYHNKRMYKCVGVCSLNAHIKSVVVLLLSLKIKFDVGKFECQVMFKWIE